MKTSVMIGIVVGLLWGCGGSLPGQDASGGDAGADLGVEAGPPACAVAPTDNVAYQDCGGSKLGGLRCVATCGRLPQDGGLGTLLGSGCTVQIGTSTPETAICVPSCSACQ